MLDDEIIKTKGKKKKRPNKARSLRDIKLERRNKRRKKNREKAQQIKTLEAQLVALKEKRQLRDRLKQEVYDLLYLIGQKM